MTGLTTANAKLSATICAGTRAVQALVRTSSGVKLGPLFRNSIRGIVSSICVGMGSNCSVGGIARGVGLHMHHIGTMRVGSVLSRVTNDLSKVSGAVALLFTTI